MARQRNLFKPLVVVWILLLALAVLSVNVMARPGQLGVESYWTYYALDLGTAGQVKVNLANGNLVYSTTDLIYNEAGFSRVYNSLVDEKSPLGYNWMLTYNRRVMENYDGSVTVYDADGTEFYYAKIAEGVYQKPAGAPWELTVVSEEGQYFLLSNKDNTYGEYYFLAGELAKIKSETKTIRFLYNLGMLTGVTIEPDAQTISINNSTQNGLDSIVDPYQHIVSYTRNTAWDLITVQTPAEKISYSYLNHQLSGIYPEGSKGINIQYDLNGRVKSIQNADGQTTQFVYNLLKTEVITAGLQHYVYNFNSNGNLVSVEEPVGLITKGTWADISRIGSITDANGGTRTYIYNAAGDISKIVTALNGETTFEYDANGNNTRVIDPEKASMTYTYNDQNRLIGIVNDLQNTVTLTYEVNQVIYKDPNGAQTISINPTQGQLQNVDPAGTVFDTQYDGQGNPVSGVVRDKSGITLQDVQIDYVQETRSTVLTDSKNSTSIQYDSYGNIKTVQNPNGSQMQFYYTSGNMLSSIYYDGKLQYSLQYDKNGNLALVTQPNQTKPFEYFYNTQNRLSQINDPTGDSVTYGYDNVGNINKIILFNLGVKYNLALNYDKNNQLISATDFAGRTTQFFYGLNGRPTQIIYPNGVTKNYDYELANRIYKYSDASTAGKVIAGSYTYDKNGNILTSVDSITGKTTVYTYNNLNCLTSEKDPVTGELTTYTYDALGNRIQKTVYYANGLIKSSIHYYYNQSGNGVVLMYDPNGNLSTNGSRSYIWDANNRLIEVRDLQKGLIASYTYDSDNKRLSKTAGGQTIYYHYTGNRVAYETDAYGKIINMYTYTGMGEPLSITTNGTTYYYHLNPLGDVLALTDANGKTAVTYSYDAWGVLRTVNGLNINNPYRYAGYIYDSETGLYYAQGRYYDPGTGRFLNKVVDFDTTTTPILANGYIYAANNPVTAFKTLDRLYLSRYILDVEKLKTIIHLLPRCPYCGQILTGRPHICIHWHPPILWPKPLPPGPWPPFPKPGPDLIDFGDILLTPDVISGGGMVDGYDGGDYFGSMPGDGVGHGVGSYLVWLAIYMHGPGPRINIELSRDMLTEIAYAANQARVSF